MRGVKVSKVLLARVTTIQLTLFQRFSIFENRSFALVLQFILSLGRQFLSFLPHYLFVSQAISISINFRSISINSEQLINSGSSFEPSVHWLEKKKENSRHELSLHQMYERQIKPRKKRKVKWKSTCKNLSFLRKAKTSFQECTDI